MKSSSGRRLLTPNVFEDVGALLKKTAAAVVMPRFAALQPSDTEMKSPNEPVTIADREAEALIGEALRLLLPEARIVGEEACAADPSLIDNLGEGAVWIVDPIDGTANFAAGRPPFAMMVALLQGGETVGSWILDPLTDRLAVAERGSGAWIDGERLHTSADFSDLSSLSGIVSEAFLPAEQRGLVDGLRQAVGLVVPTARCAGHEYPVVATGARHFTLYWRTLAWDHAPGALFLTEAGGTVTHLDGSPYRPATPRPGLLLAHNGLISKALLNVMKLHG
jgi:fructose-1,6-bisphosphatase/inositol monophosphatase family enzyme